MFGYMFTYNMLNAMWTYHPNSYFQSCDLNVRGIVDQASTFQNYYTVFAGSQTQ